MDPPRMKHMVAAIATVMFAVILLVLAPAAAASDVGQKDLDLDQVAAMAPASADNTTAQSAVVLAQEVPRSDFKGYVTSLAVTNSRGAGKTALQKEVTQADSVFSDVPNSIDGLGADEYLSLEVSTPGAQRSGPSIVLDRIRIR